MFKWLLSLFKRPKTKYYDNHYNLLDKQPIEIMQDRLTHHEFIGFLKGNIIKYNCRAGLKVGESYDKDKTKQARYEQWLSEALDGKRINPRI